MIKYFNFSVKSLVVFFILGVFNACSSTKKEDEQMYQTIYQSLKDNQSKFVFKLDGKDFYNSKSIFTGSLEIVHNSFSINYSDQFDSNVMIHFGGYEWYKEHPVIVPIKLDNGYLSNVMIGRIKDKAKKLGDGYLMSEGSITFRTLTKAKIIIEIVGKAKKYPKVDAESPSFDVKGFIVCKNPEIKYADIDEKATFYGQ